MKVYFIINGDTYNEKAQTLVTLNKMSTGRGATFTEGWYLRLANDNIPLDLKTFAKLDEDFHQTFISKDLGEQACQKVYSLSMEQFKGNFNQYTSAFRLAQAQQNQPGQHPDRHPSMRGLQSAGHNDDCCCPPFGPGKDWMEMGTMAQQSRGIS